MSDTAKRLAGPVVGGVTEATLFTAASGTPDITTTVRQIIVANTTTTRQSFKLGIGADAPGTRIFSDLFVEPNQAFDWTGFLPLAEAETLRWTAPATLTVTVTGVESA